jgi:hypothetical protein
MARHEDKSLLEAALVGYQSELARINGVIADLQKQLGYRTGRPAKSMGERAVPTPLRDRKKKHNISAEGRARIAEAQRKRWAAAKKLAKASL